MHLPKGFVHQLRRSNQATGVCLCEAAQPPRRHTTMAFLQPLLASKYNEVAPHIPLNVAPSTIGLECQTRAGNVLLLGGSVGAATYSNIAIGSERIILQDKKYIME